jgi:phage tail sheath protein FI
MTFRVSPGVDWQEIDLTTVVPAVSTTKAAIAGVFSWGPADQAVQVSSEIDLRNNFLTPTDTNFETWLTAASYLAYSQQLYISRAVDSNTYNAVANTGTTTPIQIKNLDAYEALSGTFSNNVLWFARYPGAAGNSLRVSVCDSNSAYQSVVGAPTNANNTVEFDFGVGSTSGTLKITNSSGSNTANADASADATNILSSIQVGDYLIIGNNAVGVQTVQVTSKSSPVIISNGVVTATLTLGSRVATNSNVSQTLVTRTWEFSGIIGVPPGTSTYANNLGVTGDELHVVVVDQNGVFTGTKGAVLEKWVGLSRGTDAQADQGGSNYYAHVINQGSAYLYWGSDRPGAASNTTVNVVPSTNVLPLSQTMSGGTDSASESTIAPSAITNAYDVFADAESIDVALILGGKSVGGVSGEQVPNYITDNITTKRKDCINFVSPPLAAVVNNKGNEDSAVVTFRNRLSSTSYTVMDSGYKYMYDKYNDKYRWVPLNGDVAGLCAYTDQTRDPWWSPAGFNRGQLKNVVKLAWNPNADARDDLYSAGVNPVVSFPGQGVVLYGDKTLQAKSSAFDRINVRRLFIVLEKAISTAAKFTLFEFNDSFTQAQFRNMVEPYLRDIKGRRGIYDFKVVCDGTNNTPQVVDSNSFVGDIYIKPERSINFIRLNFVAVASGVDFNEVVGQF